MVQTSKLLALIGTILSILGWFFFPLYVYTNTVYGIGALLSLGTAFSTAFSLIHYVLIIVFLIFILACLVQIVGIPNGIAAIVGGGITFLVSVFIILGAFGILPVFTDGIGFLMDHVDWIPGIIPIPLELPGAGLGTYIAAVGGALSLASGFLPRE